MNSPNISGGLAHKMPIDLANTLNSEARASKLWEGITPIAQNEFLCWIENAKQEKTRAKRISRTVEELLDGQKRPCCWAGCIHRTDKQPSPSQRFVYKLDKKPKNKN